MRKFLLLSLLTVLFGAFPAYAEVTDCSLSVAVSLNIKNSTEIDISAIYVAQSKTGVPGWSENLLKTETRLKRGAIVSVPLERGGSATLWTIKTVDTRGRETLYGNLPLSSVYDLELQPGGKTKYQQISDT